MLNRRARFPDLRRLLPGMFAAAALLIAGCGANLYSVRDEIDLGQRFDREIRDNPGRFPILENEQIRLYVQEMVDRLLAGPAIKYRGTFTYRVTIIHDDEVVNAFTLPGGYIYVYTGLLKFADNDAMLAGILGHEIAHAEERHATQQMSAQRGIEQVFSTTLGEDSTDAATLIGGIATVITMIQHSKEQELEADTRSFEYLRGSPYWPGGIKLFFEKLLREERTEAEGGDDWSSTHPMPQNRIANLNKLLRESSTPKPTAESLGLVSYRRFKRQLSTATRRAYDEDE